MRARKGRGPKPTCSGPGRRATGAPRSSAACRTSGLLLPCAAEPWALPSARGHQLRGRRRRAMNCRRVEQLLFDHLEGLLPARETGAVAAHLDGCLSCRRRRDAFLALRGELRGLGEVQPPPHLARRAVHRWTIERDTHQRAVDSPSAGYAPPRTHSWPLLGHNTFAARLVLLS